MVPTSERSPRRALVLVLGIAVLFVVVSLGTARLMGRSDGVERLIVIPSGTAARIAAGEDVALVPSDLRFRLRDRLVVVNNDVTAHQVGPFTVGAGERLEKRFSEAATFSGFCSLHPGGGISIEVGSK